MVVLCLAVGGIVLCSCSVVNAARKVAHDVEGNKATIDAFSGTVKSGEDATFEATYATTGAAPATVVYAVRPPTGLAFQETPSGSTGGSGTTSVDLIVNSSGEFSCAPSSPGQPPTCQKLGAATATAENKLFDFYTPAHWVAFLKDFSLAAGLAGDKVTSSTMTVNGFALQCVDFDAPGIPGTSTICTTAQGILGYVKVASDTTSFEITSYSATPSASLFALPAGATVTTAPPSEAHT
jgi:hypothetical protein